MLYPAELLTHIGAGDENRTHAASLEGWNSTIELHPRTKKHNVLNEQLLYYHKKDCVSIIFIIFLLNSFLCYTGFKIIHI